MKLSQTTYGKAVTLFLIVVFVTVIVQSIIGTSGGGSAIPQSTECLGTPIKLSYPFAGGFLEPHGCAPQCDDQVQHYLLYSNGQATQCQILPGCLDWGEDRGVTCIPPGESSAS